MKFILFILMLLAYSLQSFAQTEKSDWRNKIFVVCPGQMDSPDIAKRTVIGASLKATFDIINYQPANIKIQCADSLCAFIDAFKKSTLVNLKNLNFLEDSLGYSLIINYHYSNYTYPDHADYSKRDTIDLYFRSPLYITIDPAFAIDVDKKNKTVTYTDHIYSEKRIKVKEDILVEKVFSGNSDSSIIIKNNCPYFTKEILKKADIWHKTDFEYKLKAAGHEGFSPKKYYLKFYIITQPSQCIR